MPIRGPLSHLDLNVSDPAASIRFYGLVLDYLGYERHDIEPTRVGWSLDLGDGARWGIEVRSPREPAPRTHHERANPGIDHLAFHAASRADVEGVALMLEAAGFPVADPPREYDHSPGYYATAFDDPDGIRIEVVHDPTTNP